MHILATLAFQALDIVTALTVWERDRWSMHS
jgi:hypothetical protein